MAEAPRTFEVKKQCPMCPAILTVEFEQQPPVTIGAQIHSRATMTRQSRAQFEAHLARHAEGVDGAG